MKKAVSFICSDFNESIISFSKKIENELNIDVLVFDDKNQSIYSKYSKAEITDSMLIDCGYVGCNPETTHIKKQIIAWDRMLYYLCEVEHNYDFIFAFEEDCFIPSIEAINNLLTKYCKYDLAVRNHKNKPDMIPDWHWKSIFNSIAPPYYHSMVCSVGLSKNMLQSVKSFVSTNKRLFHIEALFNTIASHDRLKVKIAQELRGIVWQGNWGLNDFLKFKNTIFHPVKDFEKHDYYRELLLRYNQQSDSCYPNECFSVEPKHVQQLSYPDFLRK